MQQDTTARSAYVHMAIRTAAVYTAERRVRRVGGPPVYVDIPGVYEVDPNFPDTEQTSGELALLGIVARLAEQDVTIRQLKRKIELLEDVVERGEMEEVEDLCGVDDGSDDERSDTEEVWEEETIESSDESEDEAQRAEESVRDTSSVAGSPDDETQSTVGSESTKRAYRTRAVRTGLPDERGIRSRVGPWSAAEEVSDPEPSLWAGKKVNRAAERVSARLKRGRSTSRETDNGEGSSSHAGPSYSMSHQDDVGQRH